MNGKGPGAAHGLNGPAAAAEAHPRMAPRGAPADPSPATGPVRAGALVGDFVTVQCVALVDGDVALARGDDGVVHGTRVAARRLRSTLRVFAALFEPRAAAALDEELRWWASTLGPVRDLEVLQARLDSLVTEPADDPLMGPAKHWLDEELRRDRLDHWAAAREALHGERHHALLTAFAGWGAHPPWTGDALRPASSLGPMVDRARHLVVVQLERAERSDDLDDLHRVRKAAKRARYAAEVLAPIAGPRVRKGARRDARLQDVLGEHRDSVVSSELLRRWATEAGTPGSIGFAFGLLHEREQLRTREAREATRHLCRRYR